MPPKGREKENEAQIDLLIDRDDGVIFLCEIKYCAGVFFIDKSYARELKNKIEFFTKVTALKKDMQLVLITFDGYKPNLWSQDLIDVALDAQGLFKS